MPVILIKISGDKTTYQKVLYTLRFINTKANKYTSQLRAKKYSEHLWLFSAAAKKCHSEILRSVLHFDVVCLTPEYVNSIN